MTDEQLKKLLGLAFPAAQPQVLSGDLWPALQRRMTEPVAWSRVDLLVVLGVSIGAAFTLGAVPKVLLLLACL